MNGDASQPYFSIVYETFVAMDILGFPIVKGTSWVPRIDQIPVGFPERGSVCHPYR